MDRNEIKKKLKYAKPVNNKTFEEAVDTTIEYSKTSTVNEEVIIAIEELAELQKELTKYIRGEKDNIGIEEEIADVYIILGVIKKLLGLSQEDIDKIISVKISRHIIKNASRKE